MRFQVYVNGRCAPMSFERLSTAQKYRHVMRRAGKIAWIVAQPT